MRFFDAEASVGFPHHRPHSPVGDAGPTRVRSCGVLTALLKRLPDSSCGKPPYRDLRCGRWSRPCCVAPRLPATPTALPYSSYGACPVPAKAVLDRAPPGSEALRRAATAGGVRRKRAFGFPNGRPSSIAAPPGEVRPPDQDHSVTRCGDVQARVFAGSSPLCVCVDLSPLGTSWP